MISFPLVVADQLASFVDPFQIFLCHLRLREMWAMEDCAGLIGTNGECNRVACAFFLLLLCVLMVPLV